jgi:hypothetical protein
MARNLAKHISVAEEWDGKERTGRGLGLCGLMLSWNFYII